RSAEPRSRQVSSGGLPLVSMVSVFNARWRTHGVIGWCFSGSGQAVFGAEHVEGSQDESQYREVHRDIEDQGGVEFETEDIEVDGFEKRSVDEAEDPDGRTERDT